MPTFTTAEIAQRVGGELHGPGDLPIDGVEAVQFASPTQLTQIGDNKFAERWAASHARAAVVSHGIDLPDDGRAIIRVPDSDLAIAIVLELFAPAPPQVEPGIHPTAVVHPTASIGQGVSIGPHCCVGPHVVLGDRCILYPHVTVLDHSRLGCDCVIWPGSVIRERCTLGDRCILHANVTIGADGFGYRPSPDGRGLIKIPQIGTVEIGHDVEIGAATCIDRGKFAATVIGDGCKLDNLVQIGHNCRLGRCVIIAGNTGIAGTVTIGDGTMIGGMCAIKDHVTIGRGVKLAGSSAVMNDVPDGVTWAGYPARDMRAAVKEHLAVRQLPDLLRKYRKVLSDD